jgi:hypothetical protein
VTVDKLQEQEGNGGETNTMRENEKFCVLTIFVPLPVLQQRVYQNDERLTMTNSPVPNKVGPPLGPVKKLTQNQTTEKEPVRTAMSKDA